MLPHPALDHDRIFNWIPDKGESSYVNHLFKGFFHHWETLDENGRLRSFKLFTSHGIRYGAIDELADNPNISFAAAAARALVASSKLNKIMERLESDSTQKKNTL